MASPKPRKKKPVKSELSRIGNLGCIRFPKPLRSTSGIKRGDRLIVRLIGEQAIRLEKIDLPDGELPPGFAESLQVETCACDAPESCKSLPPEIVSVGWSYVQLSADLAAELGFEPDEPIRLTAEPETIEVRLARDEEVVNLEPVRCPP
jgi:bifunctional DNA-binding transcriptional regulator/antitoxin component of YhaV-PrlF toxin-antitoxin module